MKPAKLIQITDNRAFEFVDADAFDDNGGAPDGTALLYAEDAIENADAAVNAGFARFVAGEDRSDDDFEVKRFADLVGDLPENIGEMMQNEAENRFVSWCHYGAYGTIDSRWFVVA
jgi:hypothetical protein